MHNSIETIYCDTYIVIDIKCMKSNMYDEYKIY